ncbi:MAG: hypothetical protein JXA60_07935 [Candidatus Coatesbacteria bacterium]|nr:hypothetical protein [Candidatus Coatesbacteria bacterium]
MLILIVLLGISSFIHSSSLTYNYSTYKQVRYKLSSQGNISNIFSKSPPVIRLDSESDVLVSVLPSRGDSLHIRIDITPLTVTINGLTWPLSKKYNMTAILTMLPSGKGLKLRYFKGYRMSSNVFMGIYYGLLPQFPDNIKIGTTWQQAHDTKFKITPDYFPSLSVKSIFKYERDEHIEDYDLINIVVRSTQIITEKRVKGRGKADMLLKFYPSKGIVTSGTLRWLMNTDFFKDGEKERVFWDQVFSLSFIEAK